MSDQDKLPMIFTVMLDLLLWVVIIGVILAVTIALTNCSPYVRDETLFLRGVETLASEYK